MGAGANPIDPLSRPGAPGREAEAGYAATARVVGIVPPRGSREEEVPPVLDPPPAPAGLDGLMPGGEAGLVLPLVLAALRPELRLWLGEARLARAASAMRLPEKALLGLLGGAPLPPASLGDASLWAGQRLPLQTGGAAGWVELFWRPDRPQGGSRQSGRHAERGAFAIRLVLPVTGRIELRGRLEGRRLDAVMETAHPLARGMAADLAEAFDTVLHRLALCGSLTVRHTEQDRRT
ncbi:hypothetical protein [Pseudoroseomonas ludipueritiae]|uniref:Flagellar hook-length control protein-like C-terminal domain-containing protein n=1 Tax=Pseudoroseomonas ludipueritiae TaxID=198093 RepID=A0ABR7R8N7_9PROT|nr:hypothetical protein [Pseudoroseomonas ludipueritiae]MBC9177917.1 hypothetical protein [Pseudoroseomonas ludipueritiae]